jgi:hypothetical protein
VPDICSCGAPLPEDARFCHKCGKPQRDEDIPVEAPVLATPPPAIVPAAAPLRAGRPDPTIGFRNPLAVRIALLASMIGFVLFFVIGQVSQVLSLMAMLGAGTFAVYLYRRRTGLPVSVLGGIHIGWITGVFTFITVMILVTIMAVALTDNNFATVFQSQLGARSNQEMAKQVLNAFRSAKGLADILVSFFVACAIMPTVGGALGALIGRRG